jgi:hypothetical protein
MPTPKKYASAAERQLAYRRRLAAQSREQPNAYSIPTMPGHRRWKAMRNQCICILDEAIGEMQSYAQQRSDAWHDSERGELFAKTMESMAEITEALRDIDIK